MSTSNDNKLELRVQSISYAAKDTYLLELCAVDGRRLPEVTPGAHIDLHLPNGLIRSYSLVRADEQSFCYVVGIKKDAVSRGGSRYVHEQLRVGDLLTVSGPRNHFPLNLSAQHSVLIAGGIGITPIWCMSQFLEKVGASWELWYSVRSRADVAFLKELEALGPKVNLHVDDEAGRVMDMQAIISAASPEAHFYCCGPGPMLDAYERVTSERKPESVHMERFAAKESIALDGGFVVALARSGKEVAIPEGSSILDVLLEEGVAIEYSCQEGICGCWEVAVLEGEVDHRDAILSDRERAQNKSMMVCCSGAKSQRLVLDI
ncbi:MAG: PDR/VanB family oxidoreductase [Alcaligenaceae bacterium]|nr:PDR/VanB family oxidoreductase [Alcaligenaceae bacterium]